MSDPIAINTRAVMVDPSDYGRPMPGISFHDQLKFTIDTLNNHANGGITLLEAMQDIAEFENPPMTLGVAIIHALATKVIPGDTEEERKKAKAASIDEQAARWGLAAKISDAIEGEGDGMLTLSEKQVKRIRELLPLHFKTNPVVVGQVAVALGVKDDE